MSFRGLWLTGGLWRGLSRSPAEPRSAGLQFGAIPYRHVNGETVFLMITSRRTGKWIFPKGGLIEGLSPSESAAEEAYEEAGVRGRAATKPVGHYRTHRSRPGSETMVSVAMYPLEVDVQFDEWPEKGERERRWVTLAEARRLLSEPALVALAEKISGNLGVLRST